MRDFIDRFHFIAISITCDNVLERRKWYLNKATEQSISDAADHLINWTFLLNKLDSEIISTSSSSRWSNSILTRPILNLSNPTFGDGPMPFFEEPRTISKNVLTLTCKKNLTSLFFLLLVSLKCKILMRVWLKDVFFLMCQNLCKWKWIIGFNTWGLSLFLRWHQAAWSSILLLSWCVKSKQAERRCMPNDPWC